MEYNVHSQVVTGIKAQYLKLTVYIYKTNHWKKRVSVNTVIT